MERAKCTLKKTNILNLTILSTTLSVPQALSQTCITQQDGMTRHKLVASFKKLLTYHATSCRQSGAEDAGDRRETTISKSIQNKDT